MAQHTTINNAKLTWIDNIKLVATFAVIGIHVSAYGVGSEFRSGQANWNWWVCNFYESWFRCSVPLFVMISGSLLLPQDTALNVFLKKRFSRILLPFIFWSIIYIGYKLVILLKTQSYTTPHNLGPWLWQQITQGSEYHLWYVYMLIGLYLFIPILQSWIKTAGNQTILYFLSIWIIALLLKQTYVLNNTVLDLHYFSGYIGYLVLGYYISDRMTFSVNIQRIAPLLLITGFLITFGGTYLATLNTRGFSSAFYDFLTINVALLSFGAFILIKGNSGSDRRNIGNKLRSLVSKYGYGIYLSHPFLLNFMVHFKLDYKLINPVVGVPLVSLICMIFSFLLVYLISKLPYGKYVSG